jgi:competence protein ComFC
LHKDEIIALVKKKFTFIDIIDYSIVDNIICISCDIDNKSNYFILYPHGDIRYKYSDYWSYESSFNQEGYGNGIIFIDKQTLDVIKAFYYKDDLCFDDPILINYSTLNFIVTEHEERTHIIFTDNFSVLSFGGINYKIYENFILFFPYYGYSQYGTFCILDIQSKNRIDLHFILENWNESISNIEFSDFSIDSTRTYLKYKDKSLYEIESLFKNKIQFKQENVNKQYLYNIQKIKSIPNAFSLDIHSTKSFLNDDGTFDTTRTYIGELLYQIKYRYVENKIQELSEIITIKIRELFGVHIDAIIPIPPSNLNRPFQPVEEITRKISELSNIPYDLNYLYKKNTVAIKSIDDNETRKEMLKNAFSIRDKSYKNKTILLFDDLYRSGTTLKAALDILIEKGEIYNILVLTITKTRTKK